MYLFWRKNRLRVRAIRQHKGKDIKYLPIKVLLESLDKLCEDYPRLFKYEVKKFSRDVPGYAEAAAILIYYKDKDLVSAISKALTITFCDDYDFTFSCGDIEWVVF